MGGGERYNYPKYVWTPTGGWWPKDPRNWKRNTAIVFGVSLAIAAYVFKVSANNEVHQIRTNSTRWYNVLRCAILPLFSNKYP